MTSAPVRCASTPGPAGQRVSRPKNSTVAPWLVEVAVHHQRDQVVVLERAQQLAEAVLGRHGVDRQLGSWSRAPPAVSQRLSWTPATACSV